MRIDIWSNSSDMIPAKVLRRNLSDEKLIAKMADMLLADTADADIFAERDCDESRRIVLVKKDGRVFREMPVQPEAGVFDLVPLDA